MKYFQLAMICFICIAKSYGQLATRIYGDVNVEIIKEKKPKRIYVNVESSLVLTGRDSSWVDTLEKHLSQTIKIKNRVKAGKYIVSVKFLLERDGSVTDMRCLKDPGFDMCEQVRSAIIKTFPGWGVQPVKVRKYHTTFTTPQDE